MEYAKEFENLLNSTNETFIGVGNPNAKILLLHANLLFLRKIIVK